MRFLTSPLLFLGLAGLCGAQVSAPFAVDFEEHPVGAYTTAMAKQDFPPPPSDYWYYGMDQGRSEIVDDAGSKVLRVKYPAGCLGPNDSPKGCGIQIKWHLPETADTMWVGYRLQFEPGFEFVKGGKLPGLCGGKCYTGGNTPLVGDGWSARIMWRAGGDAVQYLYFTDQAGQYGDDLKWDASGSQRTFVPGVWHTVLTQVILNSVPAGASEGEKNGRVRSWFDGELALDVDTLRLVDFEEQKIDMFYFSTFHGGNDASWSPTVDNYVRYDDLWISRDAPASLLTAAVPGLQGRYATVRSCGSGVCAEGGLAEIRDVSGAVQGRVAAGGRLALPPGLYFWRVGEREGRLAVAP